MENNGAIEDSYAFIAQNCGSIDALLDSFFSWIRRHSDFYNVRTNDNEKLGFYEGVAEKKVLTAFRKQKRQFEQDTRGKTQPLLHPADAPKTAAKSGGTNDLTNERATVTKVGNSSQNEQEDELMSQLIVSNVSAVYRNDCEQMVSIVDKWLGDKGKCTSARSGDSVVYLKLSSRESAEWLAANIDREAQKYENMRDDPNVPVIAKTPKGNEKRDSTEPEEESFANQGQTSKHALETVSVYNGAKLDKYTWSQTPWEVNVEFPLLPGVGKRDVELTMDFQYLKVKVKGEVLLEGELNDRIRREDSEMTWLIQDGLLSLTLFKEREFLWTCVVNGEPSLNPKKLQSVKNAYEYDDATKAHIQKIMFDEKQRRQGLPTSDQIQNEEMLRKAWEAEGSPFKGTPFDPAKISFAN